MNPNDPTFYEDCPREILEREGLLSPASQLARMRTPMMITDVSKLSCEEFRNLYDAVTNENKKRSLEKYEQSCRDYPSYFNEGEKWAMKWWAHRCAGSREIEIQVSSLWHGTTIEYVASPADVKEAVSKMVSAAWIERIRRLRECSGMRNIEKIARARKKADRIEQMLKAKWVYYQAW